MQQKIILILRLSLSWIFLYSGITKLLTDGWSSKEFLQNTETLKPLFLWFTNTQIITWVDFLNIYGQIGIGLALLLGIFLPLATIGGSLMLALYYLAQLNFPYVGRGTTSYLIDSHIIYIICLFLIWIFDDKKTWSIKNYLTKYNLEISPP